jgi:predicted dehydrogenase
MSPVRIGLIGAGSMGALHARVIATSSAAELAWVADPSDVGYRVAERYGSTWIAEPDLGSVDAVVVAAPTHLHHQVALDVIRAGVPMLLEKPLTDDYERSVEIVEAARRAGSVLMCGFVERFNPAVRTALDIATTPVHASTVRHSPYQDRILTGVALDLLIHDVDMLMRLFGADPVVVHGMHGYFDPRSLSGREDMVEVSMRFPGGELATASVSRVSQRKVRILRIVELGRAIDVDLLRQSVTVYRHIEESSADQDSGYRQQTIIEIPVIRHQGEPLQLQLQHFLGLIAGSGDPALELDSLLPPHRVVARVGESAGTLVGV